MSKRLRKILLLAILLAVPGIYYIGRIGILPTAGADLIRDFRLAFTLYTRVLRIVERDYCVDVDKNWLVRWSVESMLGGLDPWSALLYSTECRRDEGRYSGMPVARGMALGLRDGEHRVVAALPGSRAFRLGITSGDRILSVDGIPTAELRLTQLVKGLENGRRTRLELIAAGLPDTLLITIDNTSYQPVAIPFYGLLAPGTGYARLNLFDRSVADDLKEKIASLVNRGAGGIVLDLRGNPGGFLDQAIETAGMFLQQGDTVAVVRNKKVRETVIVQKAPAYPDLPLVLLIDRGCAGASEVLAAAMKDNERAPLVGESTWGHGSIQTYYRFDGPETLCLRLTTAYINTSHDRSLEPSPEDKVDGGMKPDFLVKSRIPSVVVRRLRLEGFFRSFAGRLPDSMKPTSPTSSPPKGLLDDFAHFLKESGFELDHDELAMHREEIERDISTAVAERFFGVPGRWLAGLTGDRAVAKAEEILTGRI